MKAKGLSKLGNTKSVSPSTVAPRNIVDDLVNRYLGLPGPTAAAPTLKRTSSTTGLSQSAAKKFKSPAKGKGDVSVAQEPKMEAVASKAKSKAQLELENEAKTHSKSQVKAENKKGRESWKQIKNDLADKQIPKDKIKQQK